MYIIMFKMFILLKIDGKFKEKIIKTGIIKKKNGGRRICANKTIL